MSSQQAQEISAMAPQQAARVLGLPAGQAANMLQNGLDYYAITPKVGMEPTIFVSDVASTAQGNVTMLGTAQQTIVPNRNLWTIPSLINPSLLRAN